MKKVIKVTSVILILALTLSVFVGCGKTEESETDTSTKSSGATGDEVTDATVVNNEVEPLKFTVVLRDAEVSPSEIALYQDLEAKTGVKIDWMTATEAGWEEKRALLFASNTLPDAFFGYQVLRDDDVLKYGSQEMLIAIEEYITPELMPNLSAILVAHPEYRKAITAPDGHIYSLPSFDDGIVTTTNQPLFINKNWLNKVDMDVPTTMDEFYTVLKAFKENDVNGNGDPNDEIPYTFKQNNSDMFAAFGIIDDYETHIDVTKGEVYYTAVTPEYKDAISYYNKMFLEGLIDQEAFTQDSKAFKAKCKTEERFVGTFQSWRSTGWAIEEGDDSYIPVPPMTGPTGITMWPEMTNGIISKGSFAITSNAEDPEYIMAWVDNMYDPEFAVQASFSLKIGLHLEYNSDGKLETIAEATTENRSGQVPAGRERIYNMTEVSAGLLLDVPKHMIEKQTLDTYYNEYYKNEYYPDVFFTLEEMEELSILKSDIISYTNEMYAKWIAVGGIEDEWDGYIDQLDKMKLDRLVEIYQDAYNRFYK